MAKFKSNYVSANGIRIHYLREGKGPPLVLLHGWPEFCLTWRKCLPLLSGSFDVIAPDLRGFGDTEKPDRGPTDRMTAGVLVADLHAFLDELGLTRVGIVAHDVGAFISQVLARRNPERLNGLFFFNCPYPGIGSRWASADHMTELWYQSFHQMSWAAELVGSSRSACRTYISHFLRHWSANPHAFDADLELWVDNFMKPGNLDGGFNWYRSIQRARMAAIKGSAGPTPRIDVPTRVYWGDSDPLFKVDWMDKLPEFFGVLEASVAPNAGHFVHYEQPEQACTEIKRFFGRTLAGETHPTENRK